MVAVSSSRFERRKTKVAIGFLIQLDDPGGRFEACQPLYGDLSSAGGWHVTVAACGGDHMRSGVFEIRLSGRGRDVQAERVWLPQTVDVAAGADLGNGMRAVMAYGLPILWSEDEP